MKETVRLEETYKKQIRPELKKKLAIDNVMSVPKVQKVVLNVGLKGVVKDANLIKLAEDVLERIAGQKPVRTKAKKSIAGFKIREKMPLGVMVTLRGARMYEFLDKLINLALPNVRDFQGVTKNFDKFGNYNLGIKEWNIFPELYYEVGDRVFGMNVTICINSDSKEHSFELLKSFGMPFKK